MPEECTGALGKLFFAFVSSLVELGHRKTLVQEDLWDTAQCVLARILAQTQGCCVTNKPQMSKRRADSATSQAEVGCADDGQRDGGSGS